MGRVVDQLREDVVERLLAVARVEDWNGRPMAAAVTREAAQDVVRARHAGVDRLIDAMVLWRAVGRVAARAFQKGHRQGLVDQMVVEIEAMQGRASS